jgi:hypothetical protein
MNPLKTCLRGKLAASLLLLSILCSGAMIGVPLVNASNPPLSIPTYAYLAISPNPVGVGQQVFLVMWLHMAPPTASGKAGDNWHNFSIDVTKPNGNKETIGPMPSDPTGSAYSIYYPDQIGTYTFVFKYPGQVLSLYNPQNGLPGSTSVYVNDTFLPSSATATLTVQQQQVPGPIYNPLPANFWTRPINQQNTAWASITSNWLGGAQMGGYNLWQQSGIAPSSAHIMWTRPIEFGGVSGGKTTIPGVGFYSGGSYEGRFANSIIMYGRLYYQEPLGHSNTGGGYTCIDLRTGQVMWHRDDIGVIGGSASPTFGQLFDYESPNQHGVAGGTLWATAAATQYAATAGGVWTAYDGFTGKMLYNLTGVPSGTSVYTDKGEVLNYIFTYNTTTRTGWMGLWNNTQDSQGLHLANDTSTSGWQWRPNGKVVDMSKAYSWNVTLPSLPGNAAPAIVQILPGDIILGRSSAIAAGVGDKFTPDPYTIWAISDKPANRGQLLWLKNYPAPTNNLTRRFATLPIDPVNRVFVMSDVETMQWLGYNLDTGDLLWGPTNVSFRAYQYYGSGEGGGQRGVLAYGNLYVQGFGGEIFCFSAKNGSLLWRFNDTNSGLDTPWGLRPIFLSAIADGKVYAFNNEHSPNTPLYQGEKVYCIDALTGKELWSMSGWAGQTGGQGRSTSVLADGFLCYYNYYDGQIYCVGKGPSATTIQAPMASVSKGQSMIIQGTVTDQSPGAKGKPAVSDESMSDWMENLYMNLPLSATVKGVPVKLTAVDPNGNTVDIATVTSDANGMYYYKWAPSMEGSYKITASFQGSNSYWPSSAQTAIGVDPAIAASSASPIVITPAPSQTVTPTPIQTPGQSTQPTPAVQPTSEGVSTTTYVAIAVAVIAIVAAAAVVSLRRRK